MYGLTLTAIAKNETPYLIEWVNFHRSVGINHIFIYDNDSIIPIKETLKKYIDAGIVDVIKFSGRGNQMVSYDHFLATHGHKTKWNIFGDIDEFFFPVVKDTIQDVLVDYEQYGGLNISWKIYGSNNHLTKPDGYTIENYLLGSDSQWEENLHTKCVVQPSRVLKFGSNPHFCFYKSPYFAVSEDYQLITNAWANKHCSDKIRCNHYCFRSLEEARIKLAKPRADVADPTIPGKTMDDFYRFEQHCTIEDKSALRFVEKMKGMYL